MTFPDRYHLSIIGLPVGILGLALNMALWIGGAAILSTNGNDNFTLLTKASVHKLAPRHQLRPGSDKSKKATASWISYDAFQNLIAQRGDVNQAAFQNKIKPTPNAEMRIQKLANTASPSKPARAAAPPHRPVKPEKAKKPSDKHSAPPQLALAWHLNSPNKNEKPIQQALKNKLGKGAVNTKIPDKKSEKQAQKDQHLIEKKIKQWWDSRLNKLLQQRPFAAAATATRASAAANKQKGKPTSAPKSDRQSPPASFVHADHLVRPGKVVAGPGIEIKTAVPDFSAVTLASSVPRSMKANVTFDQSGAVTYVKITQSSTYPNFDAAVLASLYRWRAVGKKMEHINTSFTMHFTILW